ncbi:putative G-protein coupled receptor 33 [Discoglossus pictus]
MSINSSSELYINITNERPTPNFTASKIFPVVLFLLTFVFGLIGNCLYLWVLKFRMKKTVNTTLFFHLILAYLIFTLVTPFLALYLLFKPHWIFGTFLCKVINSTLTFSMYVSVFILTMISMDRYMLVFHPHWYRRHMHHGHATVICLVFWSLAFLFSSPYLVFRQVRQDNKTNICYNDYSLSGKWDNEKKLQVKWGLFFFRLLLGFLFPLFFITVCYLQISLKLKKAHLTRSNKPSKIIFAAIISFFICWTPYHVLYGMLVVDGQFQESIINALTVLTVCLTCFNSCFTPVLYLFIMESFKEMFRKSILSLIENAFNENFISVDRSLEEKSELPSSSTIK